MIKETLLILLIFVCGFAAHSLLVFNCVTEITDEMFFKEMLQRFQENHNYTLGQYDCNNYSNDFNMLANHLGFESYQFINYGECHAYTLVAFEPISGRIVKRNDKINYCEE